MVELSFSLIDFEFPVLGEYFYRHFSTLTSCHFATYKELIRWHFLLDYQQPFSDFLQWFWDLCKEGITNLDELPKVFTTVSEYFEKVLTFVHPAFLPLLSFAVVISLLFRFLRLD